MSYILIDVHMILRVESLHNSLYMVLVRSAHIIRDRSFLPPDRHAVSALREQENKYHDLESRIIAYDRFLEDTIESWAQCIDTDPIEGWLGRCTRSVNTEVSIGNECSSLAFM